MKKNISIIFLLTILLFATQVIAFASKKETKDARLLLPDVRTEAVSREFRDQLTGKICLTTSYAKVLLENAGAFPALSKALEEEHSRKHNSEAVKVAGEQEKKAAKFIRETSSDEPFFSLETGIIRRADTAIVSIQIDLDTWFGGTHPERHHLGYNYDPVTGKQLLLKNVVKDLKALEPLAARALTSLNTEEQRHFDPTYLKTLRNAFKEEAKVKKTEQRHIHWVMDEQWLILLFDTYYFGSHASGPALLFIPIKDNENIFVGKYIK